MKITKILSICLLSLLCSNLHSYGLIKIDDNSVNLAIQYGLKMKEHSTRDILGNNWINNNNGIILNVYSPFIQLVSKSTNEPTTGNTEEDIKNIKNKLNNHIKKITQKNAVRFIVDLHGDNPDFAKEYKSFIVDVNDYYSNDKDKKLIKPKKEVIQKVADKDNFDPKHPFSAINLYEYKFSDISELKEYYLVIISNDGIETKFKIDNSKIF